MFVTVTPAGAFVALSAKAFQSDLQYLMAVSMLPVAAWLSAKWFVPFFGEKIQLSAYEYLERRFGLGGANLRQPCFPHCPELLAPSRHAALEREALPLPFGACQILPSAFGGNIGNNGAITVAPLATSARCTSEQ